MMESLKELILRRMNNPEALSSAGPLLIVAGILVLYAGGLIFVILRTLRAPKLGLEAPVETLTESKLTFLNSFGKFRNYVETKLVRKKKEASRSYLADIASLKLEVERLVEENISLRSMERSAISKSLERAESSAPAPSPNYADKSAEVAELKLKLAVAEQNAITAEEARRVAQAKAEEAEKQLKEMMVEIDNMYEQNAKALEQANTRRVQAQKRAEELEIELSKMKTVLRSAKEHIVAIRKAA